MPTWDSIKISSKQPQPISRALYAVIHAAFKHDAGVSLFFVDRQRQLENVICYIQVRQKNRILLKIP